LSVRGGFDDVASAFEAGDAATLERIFSGAGGLPPSWIDDPAPGTLNDPSFAFVHAYWTCRRELSRLPEASAIDLNVLAAVEGSFAIVDAGTDGRSFRLRSAVGGNMLDAMGVDFDPAIRLGAFRRCLARSTPLHAISGTGSSRWLILPLSGSDGGPGSLLVAYAEGVPPVSVSDGEREGSDGWQLRLVLDNIDQGVSLIDADGRLILHNKRLPEILDLPESLLAGRPTQFEIVRFQAERGDLGIFGSDAKAAADRLDEMLRRSTGPLRYERTKADGRIIEVMINPLPDGRQIRTFSDITARREAERGLEDSERLLRETLDSLDAEVVVYDADDRFLFANKRFHEFYPHYTSDEKLHGKSFADLLRMSIAAGVISDPLAAKDPETYVAQRLAERRNETGDYERRHSPHRWSLVKRHRTTTGLTVMLFFDITERKRIEEELASKTALLEVTLENMGEGLAVFDSRQNILVFNRLMPEYLGMPMDEIGAERSVAKIARIMSQLGAYGPGDVEDHVNTRLSSLKDPKPGENELVSPEGRLILIHHNPLPDGLVVRRYSDITERRRLETDLRDASRRAEAAATAKSAFLANMSHEIRTPLNGMIANLELLGLTRMDREQAGLVESARHAAQTLLTIIGDILDFSKIEANRIVIDPVAIEPRQVIAEVAALLSTAARQKGLELDVAVDADVPGIVMADPMRLRQVLLNLAGNAIKFTHRGRVLIGASRHDAGGQPVLSFRVEDTGVGIDKARVGDLFAAFVQADASTQRRFGGTGLGLAISRQLVELMGGKIDFDGRPDVGSTFHFTLPVEVVSESVPERRETPQPTFSAGDGIPRLPQFSSDLPLLVVEDNQMNQIVTQRQLRAFGLDCKVAADGRAGLIALEEARYALILLDLSMPEMDGFEMARRIREGEDGSFRIPIVALTANVAEGERDRVLAAGMDGYLSKPVDLPSLAGMLGRWIPLQVSARPIPEEASNAPPIAFAALMEALGTDDPSDAIEVLRLLISIMPNFLDTLREAISRRDPEAVRTTAHAATGAARNARAADLSKLLAELEVTGGDALWSDADRLMRDIGLAYRRVAHYVVSLPGGGA